MPKYSQIRKIRPTRRSVSGVYMFRSETPIEFESTLERDFIIRKEFAQCVADVVPQPCAIEYRHPRSGRIYTYTPDFLVTYRLGRANYMNYPKPLLVEVKPRQEWQRRWREWLPKWKAAWRYAQREGLEFRIHDESRIRDQTLENILFLRRYTRMQFPAEETAVLLKTVGEMGCVTRDYLLTRHYMSDFYRAEGVAHIWHLLATQQLACDLSRRFDCFTEVWLPKED